MLRIQNLRASVEDKEIIKGLNLTINSGEVHAIMGLNGSGKSTLSNILAGRDEYEVGSGVVEFLGQDLLELSPEERAQAGLFLAFQYPVELPGVSQMYFLRTALNSIRKKRGLGDISVKDFNQLVKEKAESLNLSSGMLSRAVNEGFSGGEKKRNEILQMSVLEPKLCILDETDSGLDIDALQVVASGVNNLRNGDRSFLIITHYQRLLNYIVPDVVHIMLDGKIIKTGDKDLAVLVEKNGYNWLKAA